MNEEGHHRVLGRCPDCEVLEHRVIALERALGLLMLSQTQSPELLPEWHALRIGEPVRYRFETKENSVVIKILPLRPVNEHPH